VAGIIGRVRAKWLSRRAVFLHISVVIWVPGCFAAAWWQITRAFDGNGLSYLYSVEWPIFAIVGVYFWWMLLHTDFDTVGLKGMQNQAAAAATAALEAPVDTDSPGPPTLEPPILEPRTLEPAMATVTVTGAPGAPSAPGNRVAEDQDDSEDPELAAYNARLAALAASGPKTWRSPETHVARRSL
jgi:hypothetical protein